MTDEQSPDQTPSSGSMSLPSPTPPPVEIIDPDGDRLRLRPAAEAEAGLLPPGTLAVAEQSPVGNEQWYPVVYLGGEDLGRLGDWCAWMRPGIGQWHEPTWRVPAPGDPAPLPEQLAAARAYLADHYARGRDVVFDPSGDRVPGEVTDLIDKPVCIDAMDPRARAALMRILSAVGTRIHLAMDAETACGIPTIRLAVTRTVDPDRITCGRCFAALDDAGRELDGDPPAMTTSLDRRPDDTRPQPLPQPWADILAGRPAPKLDEGGRR